jgi:sugar/nucleoside kinase (ribokinase family)
LVAASGGAIRQRVAENWPENLSSYEQGDRVGADLVTIGEALVCLAAREGRLDAAHRLSKSVGGTESNTAIGLARFGCAATWISAVGDDPMGDEILRTLRGEGVDVSHVRRDPDAPTGMMLRERRAIDEVHVFYYRRGSAASLLGPGDVPAELVASARRAHVTGVTLALGEGPRAAVHRLLELAATNDVAVSFDPNLRRKLWSDGDAAAACADLLPRVSDLLTNEDELLALTGTSHLDDGLAAMASYGIARVVVKRGDRGVAAVYDGKRHEVPPEPVAVVDTIGAGDAFNAGYLFGLLQDESFETCLRLGSWVASRVVAHPGDWEGLPDRRELDRWRDGGGTITR